MLVAITHSVRSLPCFLKMTQSDRKNSQVARSAHRLPNRPLIAIAALQTHQAFLLKSISVADKELLFREESSLARIYLSPNC
jgi:hypothetical protein